MGKLLVLQSVPLGGHIKKSLADEVLFGKLMVVVKDENGRDKLGFEYLDGPVTPKPEKIPHKRAKLRRHSGPRRKPPGPKDDGNGGPPSPRGGSVPKVPLVKV